MPNYEVNRAYPPGGKQVRSRSELVNVRLASWNIESLTGKSIELVTIELVKVLHRRRISISCIQETKWVGAKAKEIDGFNCGIQVSREPQMELAFWSRGIWWSKLWR